MSDEIKEGYYDGRALPNTVQMGFSSNNNRQIAFEVDVPSLERTVTIVLPYTDKSKQYTIDKLRACGWDGSSSFASMGKDMQVRCKYETYDGKRQLKWDVATGGKFAFNEPLNAQQQRAFVAEMMNDFKSGTNVGQSRPAPKPAAPTRQAPAPIDEIPDWVRE